MNNQLSAEALKAITDANNFTGKVHKSAGPFVIRELKETGMIAAGGGLTRKGRIVREQHIDSLMTELF